MSSCGIHVPPMLIFPRKNMKNELRGVQRDFPIKRGRKRSSSKVLKSTPNKDELLQLKRNQAAAAASHAECGMPVMWPAMAIHHYMCHCCDAMVAFTQDARKHERFGRAQNTDCNLRKCEEYRGTRLHPFPSQVLRLATPFSLPTLGCCDWQLAEGGVSPPLHSFPCEVCCDWLLAEVAKLAQGTFGSVDVHPSVVDEQVTRLGAARSTPATTSMLQLSSRLLLSQLSREPVVTLPGWNPGLCFQRQLVLHRSGVREALVKNPGDADQKGGHQELAVPSIITPHQHKSLGTQHKVVQAQTLLLHARAVPFPPSPVQEDVTLLPIVSASSDGGALRVLLCLGEHTFKLSSAEAALSLKYKPGRRALQMGCASPYSGKREPPLRIRKQGGLQNATRISGDTEWETAVFLLSDTDQNGAPQEFSVSFVITPHQYNSLGTQRKVRKPRCNNRGIDSLDNAFTEHDITYAQTNYLKQRHISDMVLADKVEILGRVILLQMGRNSMIEQLEKLCHKSQKRYRSSEAKEVEETQRFCGGITCKDCKCKVCTVLYLRHHSNLPCTSQDLIVASYSGVIVEEHANKKISYELTRPDCGVTIHWKETCAEKNILGHKKCVLRETTSRTEYCLASGLSLDCVTPSREHAALCGWWLACGEPAHKPQTTTPRQELPRSQSMSNNSTGVKGEEGVAYHDNDEEGGGVEGVPLQPGGGNPIRMFRIWRTGRTLPTTGGLSRATCVFLRRCIPSLLHLAFHHHIHYMNLGKESSAPITSPLTQDSNPETPAPQIGGAPTDCATGRRQEMDLKTDTKVDTGDDPFRMDRPSGVIQCQWGNPMITIL
ncbi:hypothetical protein PR048_020245 [Dryococelus australis]|uniref:Uncharacterized protein n=1 Tax=Dryococelus australis TaxID=614101 RepID=A0ABQ9H5S5_9NEOP|nr:hypothetical protein PR048_020245 [Dryococelus australis]